jgi:predicted RNase H-like nuclease
VPVRVLTPVVGVDGCRGAWLAATVVGDERSARLVGWQLDRFSSVLAGADDAQVVGVDIPVGLVAAGRRACDVAGRLALGGRAAARLFLVPSRDAVEAPTFDAANDLLRSRGEPAVSWQTYALSRAVLEVDEVADDARVHEVHPDLSFLAMTGRVLASKHTGAGLAERTAALGGWLDVDAAVAAAPRGAGHGDVLDALAAAWTACRIRDGRAVVYPDDAAARVPAIRA